MDGMDQNPYESPESAPEVENLPEAQPRRGNGCLGVLAILWIMPVLVDTIEFFARTRPMTTLNVLAIVATSAVGAALLLWIARRTF